MTGPHSKGDVIDGRYEVQAYVGEGGMQFVYSAKDNILGRIVALKTPKNSSAEKRFHRSAIVAARVNHPNVAKTLGYVETDGKRYLVKEFVAGLDLAQALLQRAKYLDPYLAAKIFHYLSKGLAASHHVGVIHRDLKPTNVMIGGEFQLAAIKITDFGIAKMANEELAEVAEKGADSITGSKTAVGALPYMAPEAIETPREVGLSVDVWSIGAMMYQLLTGTAPYGTGLRAVKLIIEAATPEFPAFVKANKQLAPLSQAIIDLVLACLQKDPLKRPTADELARQCGGLYYPTGDRHMGIVREIRHKAWGFINSGGIDVFFHLNSVYGEKPSEGDSVLFAKFPGGGAWRAHPVVKLG